MLTLIVCIYNLEKYIADLFDCFLKQTNQNFRIIVIDNSSTDKSLEIVKSYSKRLKIEIYNQEKRGVQYARQLGLSKIQTKYFCFVDGDDLIDINYVNCFLNLIKQHPKIKMFEVNYQNFNDGKKYKSTSYSLETEILKVDSGKNYSFFDYKGCYQGFLWNKCFSLDIAKNNNITFDEEVYIGEDGLFIDKYLQHIDKVVVNHSKLYLYRARKNSLIHSLTKSETLKKMSLSESKRIAYIDSFISPSCPTYYYWIRKKVMLYRRFYNILKKQKNDAMAEEYKQLAKNNLKQAVQETENFPKLRSSFLIKYVFFEMYFKTGF